MKIPLCRVLRGIFYYSYSTNGCFKTICPHKKQFVPDIFMWSISGLLWRSCSISLIKIKANYRQ